MPIVAAGIMVAGSIASAKMAQRKAAGIAPGSIVNAQEQQRLAIDGNLANQSRIEQLVNRANVFNQNQANSLAEQAMPGYAKVAGKFMEQADNMLTDPYALPTEVTANLVRQAGERGVNTGIRGQAGNFSLLRDLGISQLQYGESRLSQAQSIFSTVAANAPRINPMSSTSMYVTPGQAIGVAGGNADTYQSAENARVAATNWNRAQWGQAVSSSAGAIAGYYANRTGAPTAQTGQPEIWAGGTSPAERKMNTA